MLFLKIGVLFLPLVMAAFSMVIYYGLKRTYATQKIAWPGLAIWVGVLLGSIVINFLLLMVFVFGILTLYL